MAVEPAGLGKLYLGVHLKRILEFNLHLGMTAAPFQIGSISKCQTNTITSAATAGEHSLGAQAHIDWAETCLGLEPPARLEICTQRKS